METGPDSQIAFAIRYIRLSEGFAFAVTGWGGQPSPHSHRGRASGLSGNLIARLVGRFAFRHGARERVLNAGQAAGRNRAVHKE